MPRVGAASAPVEIPDHEGFRHHSGTGLGSGPPAGERVKEATQNKTCFMFPKSPFLDVLYVFANTSSFDVKAPSSSSHIGLPRAASRHTPTADGRGVQERPAEAAGPGEPGGGRVLRPGPPGRREPDVEK